MYFCIFLFFCSIPFIIFALLSLSLHSRNSDPGSQSRLFSPLPTTVLAFIFIARRVQHFLPSSTRVEFCLPTLLCALGNNWCLSRKKPCACAGVRTRDFQSQYSISMYDKFPINYVKKKTRGVLACWVACRGSPTHMISHDHVQLTEIYCTLYCCSKYAYSYDMYCTICVRYNFHWQNTGCYLYKYWPEKGSHILHTYRGNNIY